MIRLLIVDDSALMRRHLSQLFKAEGDFIVEVARNGGEAIARNRDFAPDVITLDINMPQMDGLTCLSVLMTERPCPVVMFSSLTAHGTMATLEALALGAVDFFAKPDGTISLSLDTVQQVLLEKVRAAASSRVHAEKTPVPAATAVVKVPAAPQTTAGTLQKLVLIGASTGGPRVLEELINQLPKDFPCPIVVAQHMPGSFTKAFAERLNRSSALKVLEVNRPLLLQAGHVYIGMGGGDVLISVRAGQRYVVPKPENASYLWHPSVSLLVSSALRQIPATDLIGVMLTGMGYDGAEEMAALKHQGGYTLAESQQSAVVFGMPAELIRRDGASQILPSPVIASALLKALVPSSVGLIESSKCL